MSDGEPSSIKRLTRCAARAPALSKRYEDRVEARFDFAVYGTRFAAHKIFIYVQTLPVKFLLILRCSSKSARRRKLRLRFAFCGAPCLRKNLLRQEFRRLATFYVYCVAPQNQLDVGNYAFALLFAVRLV